MDSSNRMNASSSEIDLVDIGILLWQRRAVILTVFIVSLIITIIVTFRVKHIYVYTTIVSLGTETTAAGVQMQLISSQTARQVLNDNYIPRSLDQYLAKHPADLSIVRDIDFEVSSSESDSAILVSCKADIESANICIEIEKSASEEFISDYSNQVKIVKADFQEQLATASLELAALKSPAVFGVQRLDAEKTISEAKSALKKLQDDLVVLKVHRDKLTTAKNLDEANMKQLEQHVADVRKSNVAAAQGSGDPTNAMTNLLLSTEEQRSVNQITQAEQDLEVQLPQELSKVDADIANNVRNQHLQQQTIALSETALTKLDFSHEQAIANSQLKIQQIQARMDNVVETRILGKPVQSLKPVGQGRVATLALGILFGLIMSLLSAFFVSFIAQVRGRLVRHDSR